MNFYAKILSSGSALQFTIYLLLHHKDLILFLPCKFTMLLAKG